MPNGAAWPRLSIITPSFNQAHYLEETIRSVLLQGYPNLEYFVFDAASTDGSVEIIRKYEPWLSYWVSEKDRGQSDAINKGMRRATGVMATWLNSDDYFSQGTLEAVALTLQQHSEAAVIFGQADWITSDGRQIEAVLSRPYDRQYMLQEANSIPQSSAFIRHQAFLEVGGLDERLHFTMDYDLWFRLETQGSLVHVPQKWSYARKHESAKTSSGDTRFYEELVQVTAKYGKGGLPAGNLQWLESTHLSKAFRAFQTSDVITGQRELALVLTYLPEWRDTSKLASRIASEAWQVSPGLTGDDKSQLDFSELVCSHLPENVKDPRQVQRRAVSLLEEAFAFRNLGRANGVAARGHAWQAMQTETSQFKNKGLWSVIRRSYRKPAAITPLTASFRTQILNWLSQQSVTGQNEINAICDSVQIVTLLGGLDVFPAAQTQTWLDFLQSQQDPATGLFTGSNLPEKLIITAKSMVALNALGNHYSHPLSFIEEFLPTNSMESWLIGLDWKDPQTGQAVAALLLCAFQEFDRTQNERYLMGATRILHWLDRWRNLETGCWEPAINLGLPAYLTLASHLAPAVFFAKRPMPQGPAILKSALALQHAHGLFSPSGSAETDLHLIHVLTLFSLATNAYSEKIQPACTYAWQALWRCYRADGSFDAALPEQAVGQMKDSTLAATHQRLLTLALISTHFPKEFPAPFNWRLPSLPTVGWRDGVQAQ